MRQGITAKRRGIAGVLSSLIVATGLVVLAAGPAAASVFSNAAAITIPLSGVAAPYPSPITVSGLSGTVVDVNVTLTGMNHTFTSDIDILLVGPAGQKVVLMADVGGNTDLAGFTLTLDDAAAVSLPDNTQIVSGTFRPTVGVAEAFNGGAPAPAGPYLTTLAGFNGAAANGVWNLFVYDDVALASGTIAGGWSLNILANPTITSFTPTSGGAGTSVVITGTSLTNTSAVSFNGIATTFTNNSATQVTATAPAGVTTGPITLTTTPGGTATSATNFTVTPTITSFTPTSGKVGTSVVITGTNLTGTTGVKFNGTSATFTANSATQVTATVPAGAGTGPISLTTPGGTATSGNNFVVKHARNVSLNVNGNKANGTVHVNDGFDACRSGVPVKVQHLENGNWHTVGSTLTKSNGTYKVAGLTDPGKYRT